MSIGIQEQARRRVVKQEAGSKADKETPAISQTNIKPTKLIKPNTNKTNHTSLGHGSMRLVHRKNNPNKKTLIYIPYA